MRRLFYPWPLTPYCCGDACFIPGLQLIYSFVMRCLFYPWPLTPCCCGGIRFISASSLFMRCLSYPWSLTLIIYIKYLSLMSQWLHLRPPSNSTRMYEGGHTVATYFYPTHIYLFLILILVIIAKLFIYLFTLKKGKK